MAEETRTGRCLCGAVTFSFAAARHDVDVCHCAMCRRWTAGPFLSVPHHGTITFEGGQNIGIYNSSEWGERAFCKVCGTPLYWRFRGSDEYAMSAGALDDQSGLTLATEIFIDEKPAYYAFANETKQMTGEEAMAAFMDGKTIGQE